MAERKKSGWLLWLWILFSLLSGCTSYEELVADAEETGDWSRVEAWEMRRERAESHEALAEACRAAGRVYLCDGKHESKHTTCECADQWRARQILGQQDPFPDGDDDE